MRRLASLGIFALVVILGVAIVAVLLQVFLNVDSVQEAVLPVQSVAEEQDIYPPAQDVYQVEVRNAVGVSGVGERMRNYLRSKGYDVVGVGNHSSFDLPQTLVIDRVNNPEIARQVAASLGLPLDRIQLDVRDDYHLDVSILIGKDYGLIPPFADTLASMP